VIVELVRQAVAAGARCAKACEVLGLSLRTVERWRRDPEADDGRRGPRTRPANALTTDDEARVIALLTSESYRGLSPKQLVPMLADNEKTFVASESTIYRLMRRRGLRRAPRPTRRHHVTRASTMHRATGPNQVWSWDITWLPTQVRGKYFYLYLVMDVWSRRIVGWTVEPMESPDRASALITAICDAERLDPRGLVLHSDNGSAMRGSVMTRTLQWLGIVPSFSRPHVSDDNAYSEALFRTLKYAPAYPRHPFTTVTHATGWVTNFVAWYNTRHRHSGIRYVTPDERHTGADVAILAGRHQVYQAARRANPTRWSRTTRDWSRIETVHLNPPRAADGAA
jgi:putative transposase